MSHDEFLAKYYKIAEFAMKCCEKARREGLLSLEKDLNREKIKERDIFEYGLSFVIDGYDAEIIEKILSNIIKQEKDEDTIKLKNIQKEAVYMIQQGFNPKIVSALLNSYTGLTLKEDKLLDDDFYMN